MYQGGFGPVHITYRLDHGRKVGKMWRFFLDVIIFPFQKSKKEKDYKLDQSFWFT
jgi:hypothetical protein